MKSTATAGPRIVGHDQATDERSTTMAEDRRMTAAQVVDKLMSEQHRDVLRESVAWVL